MAKRTAKAAGKILPVYAISGQDPFLVDRALQELLDQLLPADQRMMALFVPPPENLPPVSEVLDELRTLPFLADRRVVCLKDASSFISENREVLENYLDKPSSCGVLIFTMPTFDKRTRLSKKIQQLGGLIEIKKMYPNQLAAYASQYCRTEHGKTLTSFTADLLIQFVGEEPGRICREIDKLSLYVDQRKTVTEEDVEALVGHNRAFDAFEVIDSMAAGRTGQALQQLRRMFSMDKNTEYTVVGAFGYHFRKLFSAKAMLKKGLNRDLVSKKLNVFSRFQKPFYDQVGRFSQEQLARLLMQVGQIDYDIKKGRTTAPSAIERLVIQAAEVLDAR